MAARPPGDGAAREDAIADDVLAYVTTTGALMGVPVDLAKRRVRGAAVQLIANLFVNNTAGIARAALARNGTLF